MILIFFGPPGAGKGTQANLIANFFSIPHLSTGEILRDKLSEKDELSKKLKLIMENGELVSDEILNEIVIKRINEKDCKKGFVLDGYPRTIDQAMFLKFSLDSKNLKINKIIDIEIDELTILKRIEKRYKIENRQDDKDDVIINRIKQYETETKPLSDFYKSQNPSIYKIINGDQEIENIHSAIIEVLKND